MIPRPIALTGLVGAAFGAPYVISNAPDGWGPNQTAESQTAEASQTAPADPSLLERPKLDALHGPGAELYSSPAPLEGRRNLPLAELLHWNVSKDWVYQGWARKSTGLADPGLFGVRVPVVTGAAMTDVAGALSYYFDNAGRLQRIRLHGRTADTTELVHLATTRFGMRPALAHTPGQQYFEAVEGERIRSVLKTTPEAVLWSTSPHGSFRVDLEVNRPGSEHWYTPRVEELKIAGFTDHAPESTPGAEPAKKPVLPPSAVVPDAGEAASATQGSSVATESATEAAAPAKPSSDIAPLRGYRDRFRWPD